MEILRVYRRKRPESETASPSEGSTSRAGSSPWLSMINRRCSASLNSTQLSCSPHTLSVSHRTVGRDQMDGCGGSKEEAAPSVPPPPAMPAFLKLSDKAMHDKFDELQAMEAARLGTESSDLDPAAQNKWACLPPDRELDRYANIQPFANNRIILPVPPGQNDYINASPVTFTSSSYKQSDLKSSLQDKYICMQGPKKNTVDHTWLMLWHQISIPDNAAPGVIIMLTPIRGTAPDGSGKVIEKCYQYYPMDENDPPLRINENEGIGPDFKATVRFISREDNVQDTGIEVRQLGMTVDGEDDEEKVIWHFFYPHWPDFGALDDKNISSILALMEMSRKKNTEVDNPRVVHCSAGVGRTGTFVAMEFLMSELQGGAWEGWDDMPHEIEHIDPIYDCVNQLRMQRKTMVQAWEQYQFIYEVLRKMWEEKYLVPCVGGEHKHDPGVHLPEPPPKPTE